MTALSCDCAPLAYTQQRSAFASLVQEEHNKAAAKVLPRDVAQ